MIGAPGIPPPPAVGSAAAPGPDALAAVTWIRGGGTLRGTRVAHTWEGAILEGIIGDRILRCADGHLFVSSETARLFGSVHLGAKRFMRCPVDGKWRMASNVNSSDLTEAELQEARSYHT
jgi:hypothetical protein